MRFAHKKWTPFADVVYSAHLEWVGWDLEMTVERVVGGELEETPASTGLCLGCHDSGALSPPLLILCKPSPALCWILFLPHWVWGLYHWTPCSAQGLCEWRHGEWFHVAESPCLSPTPAPLCVIQHPDCHRDLNVPFFFFLIPSFGLVWHIETPTCHSC